MSLLNRILPGFIRRSYLRRFAFIVAIVLVLIAGAGLFFQQSVSAELTHEVHNQMETTATLEAEQLHEWVREHEQETRMLSEFQELESGDEGPIRNQMQHELNALGGSVQAIHYVNLDSEKIRYSTEEATEGSSLADRNLRWTHGSLAFEEARVAVSAGYEHNGQELIAFVSPVQGTSNAVMMTVDVTEVADRFKNPIEGGYTQVVDSQGIIEIAENQSQALTTYSGGENSPALQAGLNGESGVIERDDTKEIVAFAPVEGTEWVVLAHAPTETAYVLRSTIAKDFLLFTGIALFGFVALGLTIGRNTVGSLNTLTTKAQQLEKGDLETDLASTRDDEIGTLFEAFANMQDSLKRRISEAEEAKEQAEASQQEADRARHDAEQAKREAEQLSAHLREKANEFNTTIGAAADGDFTQRLDPNSESEAMTKIAESFNEMMDDIETTVRNIQRFAQEVAAASEQATAGATEIKEASEEVSRSIQEISTGAADQRQKLEEVSGEMNNLSATIEEAASSAQTVAETSQETADIAESGEATAQAAIEETQAVQQTMQSTVTNVEELEDMMREIGEIVDLISEIAEQTNMLALNANIEAARAGGAGGQGDGFAVVADEVKQLAEETQESAQDVGSLIEDVQSQTKTTVKEIQTAEQRVQQTTDSVGEAVDAFVRVSENIDETNNGVQEISNAMDDQAGSAEETVSMVDDVAEISQTTAEEAESVSAAAEEQASSTSQVNSNVQSLAKQAEQLQELLAQFTVSQRAEHMDTTSSSLITQAADGGLEQSDIDRENR